MFAVAEEQYALAVLQLVVGRRRQVLPALCKHWKELLAGPGEVWLKIKFRAGFAEEYHKVC